MNLTDSELKQKIEDFVYRAFGNRKRKGGFELYAEHSLRVGKNVREILSRFEKRFGVAMQDGDGRIITYAGYFHDILHDGKMEEDEIKKEMSAFASKEAIDYIILMMKILDRPKGGSFDVYFNRLMNLDSDVIILVKCAEMFDKLQRITENYSCNGNGKVVWENLIKNVEQYVLPMARKRKDLAEQRQDDDFQLAFAEIIYYLEKAVSDARIDLLEYF